MIRHDHEVMQLKFSCCYIRTQYFNQQRRIPFRLKDASRHTGLGGGKKYPCATKDYFRVAIPRRYCLAGAKALIISGSLRHD